MRGEMGPSQERQPLSRCSDVPTVRRAPVASSCVTEFSARRRSVTQSRRFCSVPRNEMTTCASSALGRLAYNYQ